MVLHWLQTLPDRGTVCELCAKKLAKREVTRVRRGKIEETRFLLATTEVAEGFEIFRADHSERMSSMTSGSDIAGRSRASGSAYLANPVWAFAAKPVTGCKHLSRGVGTAMRPVRWSLRKGTSGWKKYQKRSSASP